ncbi:MAG: glycosyltransferase 87 family protein [Acetobacteraceae bacterium]|nr:glycosyltransferase 87 family protein [Acetobacteraceae bacterium]
MTWRLPTLAAIGAILVATTLAGPMVHRGLGDMAFAALAIGQGLMVLLALRLALRCPARPALAVIAAVAVALRLALLPVAPHLSTDAYRYVWDGRVQAAGINPYRHIPEDPALAALRDEAIYPNINRRDVAVTIYPPGAQLLFLGVAGLGGGLTAMRLALLGCEAVVVAVLLAMLARFGLPSTRVLAYAWHPLAVWEIAGSGHVDAAMLALVMLGLWVGVVAGRRVAGAALLAVATLVKPFALLCLPAVWRPWDWRAPAAAVAVAVLLYLPYLSVGAGVLGYLPDYLAEERIEDGEGFWAVAALQTLFGPLPWSRPLYLAASVMLIGGLALALPFAARRDPRPEVVLRRLFWLLFAFLALLSSNWPWYNLLLLPFVALFGPVPAWVATIGGFILYDEVWADFDIGPLLRESLLNLAVLASLALSARRAVILREPLRA